MKTNRLQIIVVVATLMATMTSCKKHDGQWVREAPISFTFGDVLYSNDFEPIIIWGALDNGIYFFNEGGYELRISRDGFTSKESAKKAKLHLCFWQDVATDADIIEIQGQELKVRTIEIGKPYSLLHSWVSLYDTKYSDPTTQAYSGQDGIITFTDIIPPRYFYGTFAFTAIDELGTQVYVAGSFENIEISGGGELVQVVDHKTQEKLFMLGTEPEE